MKKYLSLLMSIMLCFSIAACDSKKNERNLNHDEVMSGNFTSISGEYINSEGEVIILEDDITAKLISDVVYVDNSYYYMNVFTDDGMYGIGLTIYPVGIEVMGWTLQDGDIVIETDISKIRIYFGQDVPMSEAEIFEQKLQ